MYDYDAWKTGWYELGEPEHVCSQCSEKEELLESASRNLKMLLKHLHSGDNDAASLDFALEGLCNVLDVDVGQFPFRLDLELLGNSCCRLEKVCDRVRCS